MLRRKFLAKTEGVIHNSKPRKMGGFAAKRRQGELGEMDVARSEEVSHSGENIGQLLIGAVFCLSCANAFGQWTNPCECGGVYRAN